MSTSALQRQISRKETDKEKLADRVIGNPELAPELLDGLQSDKAAIRYGSAKVLRIVSDRAPDVLYPEMGVFVKMLESDNNIMRWEAIYVIANLARVDEKKKFEKIFDRYFAPIPGPVMITAANVIGGAAKIARAKPRLTERIAKEILKVDRARYRTTECRRVALGRAIDTFDRIFDRIKDRDPVVALVRRQLRSPRKSTKNRAKRFLKKHHLA